MKKLVLFLTDLICRGEEHDEDEMEVIAYGVELVLIKLIFYGAWLAIGVAMGMFLECASFLLMFNLLRTNVGGYHADTRIMCFAESMLSMVLVLLVIMNISGLVLLVLAAAAVLSSVFIVLLAPVDSANKRLEPQEKTSFRRRSLIILSAEIVFAAVMLFAKIYWLCAAALLSVILVGILAAAGYKKENNKA